MPTLNGALRPAVRANSRRKVVPAGRVVDLQCLASLVCGNMQSEGVAKIALDQLFTSIHSFANKAHKFLIGPSSEELLSFGPFCARVLLENSCAALVGRLDAFRMLYLSEFQSQPEYEHGKRAKSAFAWSGDVMADEKPGALWNIDTELPKISRALFSKHLEHIYWKPATERMLDFVSTLPANPILADVLSIDSATFIGQARGRGAQLYSTLSKGVHWEFFTSALLFDEATVKTAIRDTFLLVAHLALISHFIPTAYASHRSHVVLDKYLEFREVVS